MPKGLLRVFSSTTVQSINFSLVILLYGPAVTSVHDNWKNHSISAELIQILKDDAIKVLQGIIRN